MLTLRKPDIYYTASNNIVRMKIHHGLLKLQDLVLSFKVMCN